MCFDDEKIEFWFWVPKCYRYQPSLQLCCKYESRISFHFHSKLIFIRFLFSSFCCILAYSFIMSCHYSNSLTLSFVDPFFWQKLCKLYYLRSSCIIQSIIFCTNRMTRITMLICKTFDLLRFSSISETLHINTIYDRLLTFLMIE